MTGRLREVFEAQREELVAALEEARGELRELEQHRAELLALISATETALRLRTAGVGERTRAAASDDRAPSSPVRADQLTLHQAMAVVLRDGPLTFRQIADEVNRRGLYRKRDGSTVEINQVHARSRNYRHLFEKVGNTMRLATERPRGEDNGT